MNIIIQQKLAKNLGMEILPKKKLQHLIDKSVEILEVVLNNQNISEQERAKIASRILEIENQGSNKNSFQSDQKSLNQQNQSEISDDWKQWMAESKLRNYPDTSIIQEMVKRGIDEQLAIAELNHLTTNPYFKASNSMAQLLRKLESMLEVRHQISQLSPNSSYIERRSHISKEEFLAKYYATNTPVVITDMMTEWQAMSLWTPEYFKTNYGDADVEIQNNRNSDAQYEINKARHKRELKLSEYVDMVVNGGDTNDYYMVASNRNFQRDKIKNLLDDINVYPDFLDSLNTKGKIKLWFGPGGTITPVHHDQTNLIGAQVYGRKLWRIISPDQTPFLYNYQTVFSQVDLENPDYNRYPLFRKVKIIEVIIEPGEMIFIPIGWWHQVKSLNISISLSLMNFIFPNSYKYQNPS
uniref:cupin-like domain-containing protein n=1 Tax=Okeania sp. SIO2F4 TaxID=2607790 RepID=UPI0025D404CA|nr:cupin-like domain-containing protein [Okeania sp. SIO2F4]